MGSPYLLNKRDYEVNRYGQKFVEIDEPNIYLCGC
jgi:hypothetical protein